MKAIFASSVGGGFGLHPNLLPWPRSKEDMKFFRDITMSEEVIFCGRVTAQGLPHLEGRNMFVISNQTLLEVRQDLTIKNKVHGVFTYSKFLNLSDRLPGIVIGGASLLTPELLSICTEVYHTEFKASYEADVYLSVETINWLERNKLNSTILKETEELIIRRYVNV